MTDLAIAAARAGLATARDELEELARIPSISAAPDHIDDVERSAQFTAEILHRHGLENVRTLRVAVPGAHPAVYGDWLHAGEGRPTVLLYAHHDVQPPGVVANWTTDPFTPTERAGRLYARGICDDKAGVLAHALAVSSWLTANQAIPVNVKILVEGEEEIGSPNLERFLAEHRDELAADVFVLADAGQWDVGEPAITYMLRGLVRIDVELRALDGPVHSGIFGGAVPDPTMALARLLATMTDERGDIAIAGFEDDVRPLSSKERSRIDALPANEADFRRSAGLRGDTPLAGDASRSIWERLWARPAVTVIGFDSHPIAGSSNQIVARAKARLSFRLAPGQDPQRVAATVRAHVDGHNPWGLVADVAVNEAVPAWTTEPEGPAFSAAERALERGFGKAPVAMGIGGSVPFVGPFVNAFGGIPALLIGPEDPYSRAHGEDESLHLDDWRKLIESEVHLLAELAQLELQPRNS